MGRKSAWAAARAEVFALVVMVARRGNWGGLPFLKTRNIYRRQKTRRDRYVSKLWSTHVLRANTIACHVCCVCCVCCPKLVVNRNWWCGAGQMLALLLDGLVLYLSYISPLVPK
jgi:hypothetical protein